MKHYDNLEWILYKKGLLNNKIQEEMEDHLYLCDDCMEIFLSLISEDEINGVENLIPEEFSLNVLKATKNIRPMDKTKKKKQNKKPVNDFFLYYAAVASVAIILTATGSFEKMVKIVPQLNNSISYKESKLEANKIYNFSEKVTIKTSEFVNDFQFKK